MYRYAPGMLNRVTRESLLEGLAIVGVVVAILFWTALAAASTIVQK